MPDSIRKYRFFMILFMLAFYSVSSQERTIIEFYDETPTVSDYILDFKAETSNAVVFNTEGWVIPPGHRVIVEFPFIPPNMGIAEVRLGFSWKGVVGSGTFEGWSLERFKYRVFEEALHPYEQQKRIYPSMLARSYEFRIRCNQTFRSDQASLVLQSLVIYWQRTTVD